MIAAFISLLVCSYPVAAEDGVIPSEAIPIEVTDIDSLIQALINLQKGGEKIRAPFTLLTEGNNYDVYPSAESYAITVLAAQCGKSLTPYLYIQSGGSFEYRWCRKVINVSAQVDIYSYSGGALQYSQTVPVQCTSSGIPAIVRARVVCS